MLHQTHIIVSAKTRPMSGKGLLQETPQKPDLQTHTQNVGRQILAKFGGTLLCIK